MESAANNVILSIKNVSISFPGVKALDDVSIECQRGSVHGIVGENGAGKSTLMKILSGVYTKDPGTVVFDGETIEHTTPIQALKRGLSIIYQEFNLVNTLTVGENIFLGRFSEMKGMRNIHKKARELLDSIGSTINTNKLVGELSAAEKQMVEITKALSFNSKLIIMDEPSSSLTADELKRLFTIIGDLRQKGVTVLYISHKLDEIFELCDIVTIIRDGKVIDTKPVGELNRNELITKMIGREIENEFPPRPHCVAETLMEVKTIRTRKLKDISFALKKGEILGFVGLVGAGRTEIIRAIYGADKAKELKIQLNGKSANIKKPVQAIKEGLGLVPEDRKLQGLVLPFSVQANITMASLKNITKFGFVNSSKESDICDRQIKNLAVKTPSSRTKALKLSGGNQQKCIMGRWFEIDPDILILDEPTRGIDVGTKYEIYVLIKEIAEKGGSVIMISSELPEVLAMSNRVLTICEGRITGEFNPESDSAHDIMSAAIG